MKKIMARALFVTAVLGIALSSGAVRAQTDEAAPPVSCAGRYSWLTGKCTYCEWGGACGACQIGGCS